MNKHVSIIEDSKKNEASEQVAREFPAVGLSSPTNLLDISFSEEQSLLDLCFHC